jgi:hypothetical protein
MKPPGSKFGNRTSDLIFDTHMLNHLWCNMVLGGIYLLYFKPPPPPPPFVATLALPRAYKYILSRKQIADTKSWGNVPSQTYFCLARDRDIHDASPLGKKITPHSKNQMKTSNPRHFILLIFCICSWWICHDMGWGGSQFRVRGIMQDHSP